MAEPASEPEKPPRRKTAWYWRVLRLIGLVYVVVLIFLYFGQTFLIFPGSSTQGKRVFAPAAGTELVQLRTSSGESIAALFGSVLQADGKPHPDAARRPTLLFFYGNAMCLSEARFQLDEFRRMGTNVLIPEYAGYGMSGGKPSESGCYETADAAHAHLLSRGDIDPKKIIVSGWSLGGAVAIDLASRKSTSGLAVFSTFSSMADMGSSTYPFLPTFMISAILKHRFEGARKIASVTCPVLIGHSRGDRMIPFVMADRLAASAKVPVKRISIDTPDHTEFFSDGGDAVTEGIKAFIDEIDKR
ncbi:MAG TPA: alpha/beta hydrolase [Planctomycetota bacterium]|nr:alpha/beta hydrolase [Planctomycetota bacterium]